MRNRWTRLAALLLVPMLVLTAVPEAMAVCVVTALPNNGGTSVNERAPNSNFLFGRSVYLITAAEMAASGIAQNTQIGAIGWTYAVAPGATATGSLKIYMQNTTDTTNVKSTTYATAIAPMTLVHNAAAETLPSGAVTFTIPFAGGSPFTYTTGGVYIAFDWQWAGPTTATASVLCNTALVNGLKGQQSNVSAPTTIANSNFRPETFLTPASGPTTDLAVTTLQSMGAIPQTIGSPLSVGAVVKNKGSATQSFFDVFMEIDGPDFFTDTQNVDSLDACIGTTTLSFAPFAPSLREYSPDVLGSYTQAVYVGPDQVNGNNATIRNLDVTANKYSYKYPGQLASGGAGFTGGTGEFLARFSFAQATTIDSVIADFFTVSAATYRVVIRGDNAGVPGASIYVDATDRSVLAAGAVTIRLPAPVAVGPGEIYVGVRQTNTTNAAYSFDAESPVRAGTFFYSVTPDAGPWVDFAPGTDFKLNVGTWLGACLVPLTVDVTANGATHACSGNPIVFTATPSGGSGAFTYQWTEDGVNIGGQTASTLSVTKGSPQSHTYNCKVTDDAGCTNIVDATNSTGVWDPPPTATVSGDATICTGGSANIQAALSGNSPWYLTWSDSFNQFGVTSSPAMRTVSPSSTTAYSVTVFSDSSCIGTPGGTATVTVNPTPAETSPNSLLWVTKTSLVWAANGAAANYRLYRGDPSGFGSLSSPAIDSCTEYFGPATTASGLTATPPVGGLYWYLVTGIANGSSGICEGPAGAGETVNSSGACPP